MFGRELTISNKQSAIAKNTRIQSNNSPTPGNVAHCGRGKSLKCGVFRTRRYKKELAPQTPVLCWPLFAVNESKIVFWFRFMNEIKVQQPQDRNKFGHLGVDWRVASPDPPPLSSHQLIGPGIICYQTDNSKKRLKLALTATLLSLCHVCCWLYCP